MTMLARFSDHTLRIAAWVATAFFPATVLGSIPVALAARPASSASWDSGLLGDFLFGMVVLSFPLAGFLILRQQPRNRIGWLLESIGFVWGLGFLTDTYATIGLVVAPGSLPGASAVAGATAGNWAPGIGLMAIFLILLFPDGRLPSRRWRPVAWVAGFAVVVVPVLIALSSPRLENSALPPLHNPVAWGQGRQIMTLLTYATLPLIPLSVLAAATSLVLRFRRSSGVERLQLKWLATSGAVVALLYLLAMVAPLLAAVTPFQTNGSAGVESFQTAAMSSFVLMPLAIAVAVLRHRLYGIDTVINRALVYGSLTVSLAAVYIGSVLLLQLLLSPVSGHSDLAVAGSTLAVAALFRPARKRFQVAVDRRFYRSRYDAARTLDDFAARLRHEVDLDAVAKDLSGTVNGTVQPAHLSLWIRT